MITDERLAELIATEDRRLQALYERRVSCDSGLSVDESMLLALRELKQLRAERQNADWLAREARQIGPVDARAAVANNALRGDK